MRKRVYSCRFLIHPEIGRAPVGGPPRPAPARPLSPLGPGVFLHPEHSYTTQPRSGCSIEQVDQLRRAFVDDPDRKPRPVRAGARVAPQVLELSLEGSVECHAVCFTPGLA